MNSSIDAFCSGQPAEHVAQSGDDAIKGGAYSPRDGGDEDSLSSIAERLITLEHKLDSLLNIATELRQAKSRSETPLLRRFLTPKLWTFEQYRPRTLSLQWDCAETPVDPALPSFAIVTPSYNQAKFVGRTIDSVLGQRGVEVNYLVQDGHSKDGTVDILIDYGSRLKWRSVPDEGQADAINKGFANLPGDIMGWLNSDDVLMPNALARVAELFARHRDIDIIYGNRIYIDDIDDEVGRCILPQHNAEAMTWCDFIPQETMFWRRGVWEATGGLRPDFQFALDWDFILRAASFGFRFHHLPVFLGCFRVHDAQKTTGMASRGEQEMQRLRTEHLGFTPNYRMIEKAVAPYMRRQLLVDAIYRLCRQLVRVPGFS